MLRPGRRLVILYHGNPVWQERLALAIVADGEWVLVQPNGSIKLENLRAVQDVRLVPTAGGRPAGLTGDITKFAEAPSADQRKIWLDEGVLHAELELERRARSATNPPGGGVAAAGAITCVLPAGGVFAGGSWLCCESNPMYEAGAKLPTTTGFDSVHTTRLRGFGDIKGDLFSLEWCVTGDITTRQGSLVVYQQFRDAAETGEEWGPVDGDKTPKGSKSERPATAEMPPPDARILDIADRHGRRGRDWCDVASMCQEIPMKDWPIDGPRSALWCVQYLDDAGRGGPEPYHKWWRTTCKLTLNDWGVAEHMQMMRLLSVAGAYDQLDLSNLAVVEVICRRAELIEYQYRERAREGLRASGLGTGASTSLTGASVLGGEEADLFDGVGKIAGGAMVAPQIVEFVAAELEKTAKIDKQARKAREEKALLRTNKGAEDGGHTEAKGNGKGRRQA